MSYTYLLDTNIISDLIKHPQGRCFSKISDVGESEICTSVIVACELKFGAAKKNSPRLQERVDLILDLLPVLPLTSAVEQSYAEIRITSAVEQSYAEIRNHLEKQGTPISGNDLLIAAHARSLDLIVVTNNMREFALVPQLKCDNWLA